MSRIGKSYRNCFFRFRYRYATLFLLMYGKGLYTLVPKRAFDSTEKMNDFRTLLREKIAEYIAD